jgi:galactose oxidase-like protein
MVFDAARNRVVLFGGAGAGTATLFDDTWEWDGDNWTQVADTGPSVRGGHAMAYDSLRGRVILFGGDDGQNSFGDTWAWNGTDWT